MPRRLIRQHPKKMPYMCAMCDKKPVSDEKPEPGIVLLCAACMFDHDENKKICNPYFVGDSKPEKKKPKKKVE